MLFDLILVLPVAALVGVVPGYFWAASLSPNSGRPERLALSAALSLSLVPVLAFALARLLGGGVTLPVALAAPPIVFGVGAAVFARFGPARDDGKPLLAAPEGLAAAALVPVALALALVAASDLLDLPGFWLAGACEGWPTGTCRAAGETQRFVAPVALLLLAAGAAQRFFGRGDRGAGEVAGAAVATYPTSPGGRLLLPAVLVLALARGYLGPVLHDWPFVRGLDHYSHAVMTDMIMAQGDTGSYLIYPPGFHVFSAIVSRLTGLDPLEIFPVLGPALMVFPALALYVLGDRLWGHPFGVAAAFFSVLAGGTYYYFNDAMYPNLVTSQFLVPLAVLALARLYADPNARNGALLAVLGSAVVFYHQVSSLYLALLLATVGLLFVPYLLLRDRRGGFVLLLSLASLGLLSVLYAWDTYDLGVELSGLVADTGTGGAVSDVGAALGSQPAYDLGTLIGAILSQPVAWLGLLGVVLLLAGPAPGGLRVPAALTRATILLWALILFAGSRTTFSGFPQRFGRDLGVPLSLLAALAFVVLAGTLLRRRGPALGVFAASMAAILAVSLVGLRGVQSFDQAAGPSPHLLMSPGIAEAGRWLAAHNRGGTVMVSPHANQVPSRMMLAMGHYSALQSYPESGIRDPRHMPPSGPGPLLDTLWVMNHPTGNKTKALLQEHDVRYVVLYKRMPDRPITPFWTAFKPRQDLYENVFENPDVLIVRPR